MSESQVGYPEMKHEVIIMVTSTSFLASVSDDFRPCKGIFDEVEAAFPPRTILDMRLFR